MIRIIAEGAYDTAHAIYEAHEIRKWKPDAVFFELPITPFQKILDQYSSGKLNIRQLKKALFKALGIEEKEVDHTLLDRFLEGEIEAEMLEEIESEGREIHVIQSAKKVGAEMYAVDMPLDMIEREISGEFKIEHIKNARQIIETKRLPYIIWELNDIVHYPFYFMERIIQHHAIHTTNPYKHNVNTCPVCKMGADWDRFMGGLLLAFLSRMPLSKQLKTDIKAAYIIEKIDQIREEFMATKIISAYKKLKRKLGRQPKLLVIVHLWNAHRLEMMLKGIEYE